MPRVSQCYRYLLAASAAAIAGSAHGHAEVGVAGGLLSGLLHPVLGVDHLVAMVAVGLWGAQLGKPAIWILPITFPLVMTFGALVGIAGAQLPGVEVGVAGSALVLGVMVACAIRAPIALAAVVVGAFAIWHGYAHGTELPAAVNPLAYGIGFVTATGLLHLLGILIGALIRWPQGEWIVRGCGGLVAAVGLYFLSVTTGLIS